MRNGWNFPLAGLTAKWELFAKTGTKAESIVVLEAGELAAVDLKPNQTCSLQTPFVEFRGTETDAAGFTGNKYCGYRIRFFYKGVQVKLVAVPEMLADWQAK